MTDVSSEEDIASLMDLYLLFYFIFFKIAFSVVPWTSLNLKGNHFVKAGTPSGRSSFVLLE